MLKLLFHFSFLLFTTYIGPNNKPSYDTFYKKRSIKEISNELAREQDDRVGSLKTKTFFQVRQKFFRKFPELFKTPADTIFFVEYYHIEHGTYYSTIWDRKDTVNYEYYAKEFKLSKESYFSNTTIQLASNWNTASIKREESKYGNSPQDVYAARCIQESNRIIVKNVKFKLLRFY